MPENIPFIFLLAIGASFVQRTTGFGFGIFIMTALPFLMPSYAEAVTLSGILSLTSSTVVMIKYLKYVNWKRLLPVLATFLVTSALAIVLLDRIEGRTMRMILGLILILVSLYFSFFKEKLQKIIRPTSAWQMGTGSVSGIMGGLFGMQGPPVVLYLINSEPDKNHYMGMIQTYAVLTNVIMLAVRAYSGYVTPAVGVAYLYSAGGLAIGVLAGNWAFRRLSNNIFTYVVYAYIGISGLVILLSSCF
jgi:uncharacterized membrane protein YfcA